MEVLMSRNQRLLISFGAFIIVAAMTIGAFSLGLYVGQRGWTAEPPSITGAGQVQPPQGQKLTPDKQPVAPREPLPKDKPDLIGVVQSVARRSVTIRTGEGPRLALVGDETRVRWHDGREAGPADLRRTVPVAVFGDFGDDGRTLTASLIFILPPKTQNQ
jgi:hypothetical protein